MRWCWIVWLDHGVITAELAQLGDTNYLQQTTAELSTRDKRRTIYNKQQQNYQQETTEEISKKTTAELSTTDNSMTIYKR